MVSNIATRSLTLVIPVPPSTVPFSLSSPFSSFFIHPSRASFPARTPVVRPSQLVRLRSRPASVSLCGPTSRECTNRKVEVHTCVCGNERSVGMREEKRPRSYGSAPAARLFPSLHHLSSLSLSAAHPFFRERKTHEGQGRGDRLENESRRDAKRR